LSEKIKFEYSDRITLKELADYLHKMADGFRSKSLGLRGKGQKIDIVPDDTVKFEIIAIDKSNNGELEIDISWKSEKSSTEDKLRIIPDVGKDSTDL
jgi:amphi-Trp domain-containing protein